MDPIKNAGDFLVNRKPKILKENETPPEMTEGISMAPDQFVLSVAAAEKKEDPPSPKTLLAPINKVNAVAETVQDLSKVATAGGEVLSDLTKKIDAPIKGRNLGLRDAIVEGDATNIVKEITSGTQFGRSLGIYTNVLQGDLWDKWDNAKKISDDPNASFADKAMAKLDATAATADTYQMASKLSHGVATFVQQNWVLADRQLGNIGDVAAFAGSFTDNAAKGMVDFAKKLPTEIIEGFKGNRGGIADIAREAVEGTAQHAGRGISRFAVGVNVAFAAFDVLHAGKVLSSKENGVLEKGLATATAVGSVIAATNIPGLSQIGAAFSFATSIAEAAVGKKEEKKAVKSSVSWATA
ncbi:MAG TPA: hypothetical protein DD435_02905 [Cyanobacteria bacterium UBA8530]|nr:hypothetical protein [Cyanobacteria bacterium UBA8530]